jgi:hypothetical protein
MNSNFDVCISSLGCYYWVTLQLLARMKGDEMRAPRGVFKLY